MKKTVIKHVCHEKSCVSFLIYEISPLAAHVFILRAPSLD
jgi:hypothetical protein